MHGYTHKSWPIFKRSEHDGGRFDRLIGFRRAKGIMHHITLHTLYQAKKEGWNKKHRKGDIDSTAYTGVFRRKMGCLLFVWGWGVS